MTFQPFSEFLSHRWKDTNLIIMPTGSLRSHLCYICDRASSYKLPTVFLIELWHFLFSDIFTVFRKINSKRCGCANYNYIAFLRKLKINKKKTMKNKFSYCITDLHKHQCYCIDCSGVFCRKIQNDIQYWLILDLTWLKSGSQIKDLDL